MKILYPRIYSAVQKRLCVGMTNLLSFCGFLLSFVSDCTILYHTVQFLVKYQRLETRMSATHWYLNVYTAFSLLYVLVIADVVRSWTLDRKRLEILEGSLQYRGNSLCLGSSLATHLCLPQKIY
jgi:hypothetical protein